MLAHLAEVDARRLYLPAGYLSMFSYCVSELHLSEDAAYKRIQAARAARQFPILFDAVAEGRLHLTAVGLLAPHLTPENVGELLNAVAHKTKAETEQLLAERFPRSETLALMHALPPSPVEANGSDVMASSCQLAPAQVATTASRSKVTPIAAQRFELHLTIGQGTHDKFRYAQELLSHEIPSGDVAAVLDRALDALIVTLEKRKFAATNRPRKQRHATASRRHIPAAVKRAVGERDGARCTYVSEGGQRCPARTRLETLWNDGLAVVPSGCLREEKPTVVARGHPGSRVSTSGARAAYERSPS